MNSLTLGFSKYLNALHKIQFYYVCFSGKCDSYVKIRLLPEEKFTEIKPPKTHVQKETLFPLFDQTFNMLVTIC